MNLHPTYRTHARFAVQLRRRSREMMRGQHCETNAYAMLLAATHIAQLARTVAEFERRIAALEVQKVAA
jgi:hypothetical protein